MPRDRSANECITTSRAFLVPITIEDAVDMAEVLSAPNLYEFTGGRPPTAADLTARYARLVVGHSADGRQDWYNWAVRRIEDGRAVGFLQATVVDEGRRAEIAWVVGLPWQGQGYASDAARALVDWLVAGGTPYVMAHVHPDHHASRAVARKAGLAPTEQFADGEQLWEFGS